MNLIPELRTRKRKKKKYVFTTKTIMDPLIGFLDCVLVFLQLRNDTFGRWGMFDDFDLQISFLVLLFRSFS